MPDAFFASLEICYSLLIENIEMRAAQTNNIKKDIGRSGAGEGIRTLDPNLGKVVLYP